MATKSNTDTLYQKFEAELPEYVEIAAREIYEALHTFLRHDSIPNPAGGPDLPWVSEIRIPVAKETNPKTGKIYTNVEAAWFDKPGIDDIAAELASRWCQPPELLGQYDKSAEGGIYWTINPITPAYLENYGSTLQRRKTGTARDVDVVARYWLPIDADAIRRDTITGAPLSVVSSTDAEKASIARLIAQVRDWLVGILGWPEPVRADTGNGFADFYAVPGLPIPRCPDPDNPGCLKYDAANNTLIRDVIHAISYKFTGALGSIDDAVFNPSRIMKIPGTFARKAKSTPDRPHRASKILYTPPAITPVTLDQLRLVADQTTTKTKGRTRNKPETRPSTKYQAGTGRQPVDYQPEETPPPDGTEYDARLDTRPGPVEPTDEAERTDRINRARGYLDKVPHAISGTYNENGQKGHDATFTGLGKLIRRFALTREMAEEVIGDWNDRCEPPWSEAELTHKLDSIYTDSRDADDWGKFLDDDNEDYDDATIADASGDPEELRHWINSKDLGTIIRIYLGNYLDTGEPKAVAEDSKLYRLYLDVRAEPREPKVVKRWCKSILPATLRAAWWRKWQLGLQLYRNFGTAKQPKYTSPLIPYLTHNGVLCIYHTEEDEEGNRKAAHIPLCNFDARIIAAMIVTLGESTTIEYRIRATRPAPDGNSEIKEVVVPASEFAAMNWPVERLGGDWAVRSGRGTKDSLREAIQLLSGTDGIIQYAKYNHTGWVRREGADYYLHCGGAIDKDGVVGTAAAGFVVDLGGALPLYALPDPPSGNQLTTDVQATLHLRNVGRTERPNARGIAAALVALPWRAVLGACNFAVVLAGGSGGGKTSLGCLVTQHFAPGHAYDSHTQAPVTWEATVAHLEWLAHTAKDAVLCVDNFIADAAKAQAQQAKAATILNNQGDLRGRERMGPDMKPLPSLSPRGGLLSTGEDTAARGSAKGRSLLVQVTRGETPTTNSVAYATLTPLQSDAAAGAYARTMAAYIQHVASRGLDHQLDRLKRLTTEFRNRAVREGVHGHARTPGILADLAAGYRLFLEWAETVGACQDPADASEEHWKWLCTLAPDQAEQQEEADDALRWRDLVHSALTVGRAYIAGPEGAVPTSHQAECGWKVTIWQEKDKRVAHWKHPETTRIGWFDGETIYLDENETTLVVQQMATQQHNQISQPATVKNRLVEKGWLQPGTEAGKTRYTTKSPIPLEGARRRVWKLAAAHFWPDADPVGAPPRPTE
jgi:hypothetical protein